MTDKLEEESIEKARAFFRKVSIENLVACTGCPTYLYWEGPNQITISLQGGNCHARMYPIAEPWVLASGFNVVPETQELGEEFWNWIMGAESPWRTLLDDGIEPLFSDKTKLRTGWLLSGEKLKKRNFFHLKNFCIATRMIYEKSDNIRFWKHCVDNGVHSSEAFWLCTFFMMDKKGAISFDKRANYNGWHWPINMRYFKLSNFMNGVMLKPTDAVERINSCWRGHSYDGLEGAFESAGTQVKTSFSSYKQITLGGILEIWERKKENHLEA